MQQYTVQEESVILLLFKLPKPSEKIYKLQKNIYEVGQLNSQT